MEDGKENNNTENNHVCLFFFLLAHCIFFKPSTIHDIAGDSFKQQAGAAVASCLPQAYQDIGRRPGLAVVAAVGFGSKPSVAAVRVSYSPAADHRGEGYSPEEHSRCCEGRLRETLREHQWRRRRSPKTVRVH